MIDNILFSKIAAYLSMIKNIKKPFGGIQIILSGDFYQLPPINNTYCFKAKVWNKLRINSVILKNSIRQIDDIQFQFLLENIKINNITDEIYNELQKLQNNKLNSDIKPTILYSKNIDIDKINNKEFNNLIQTYNYDIYKNCNNEYYLIYGFMIYILLSLLIRSYIIYSEYNGENVDDIKIHDNIKIIDTIIIENVDCNLLNK